MSSLPSTVRVGSSTIHGKGLFANRKIKKGEVIGVLKSKPTKKKEGPYILWLDIDSKQKRHEVLCDLKYINHSNSPNAVYYSDLTVVALRKIAEGEELTHDYGEDFADD